METALWILGAHAAVQVVGPHLWKQVQVQVLGLRHRSRGRLVLTDDDGPSKWLTPRGLEVLRERAARGGAGRCRSSHQGAEPCQGPATPIRRLSGPGQVLNTGTAGETTLPVDLTSLPSGVVVLAGESLNFQFWHREYDPSGNPTSNTTDAIEVCFR